MKVNETISVSEIAYYLQVNPKVIFDLIYSGNLQSILANKKRIFTLELPRLLEHYKIQQKLESQTWNIPPWLLKNSEGWGKTLVAMYGEEVAFPASLPPNQGKIVYDLIYDAAPKTVVEIGCFIGISSIWIASALQKLAGGHLHSVDMFLPKLPWPPFHWGFLSNPLELAQKSAKDSNLEHYVTFYSSKSGQFGKNLKGYITSPIDFLFIDGDHSVLGCLDDFITFYPYVCEGGFILLHDIYPKNCGHKGPRYLIDHFLNDPSLFQVTEIETEPNYGMALIKKLKDSQRFHPNQSISIEIMRQLSRTRTTLGYSLFYQNFLKSVLTMIKYRK